ncbi:hypothetical protein BDZ91DRAFT_762626 [Kalaharituber pfeilii]|nr:hypothetical protein BDZ91DRAFT_762626 [Kalaharituber pfeilii]
MQSMDDNEQSDANAWSLEDVQSDTTIIDCRRRENKPGRSKGTKGPYRCVLRGKWCKLAPVTKFENAAQVKEDIHRHLILFQCPLCLERFPKQHNLTRHRIKCSVLDKQKLKKSDAQPLSIEQEAIFQRLQKAKGIEAIETAVKGWEDAFAQDEYVKNVTSRKRKSTDTCSRLVSRPPKGVPQNGAGYNATRTTSAGGLNDSQHTELPPQLDISSTAPSAGLDYHAHQHKFPNQPQSPHRVTSPTDAPEDSVSGPIQEEPLQNCAYYDWPPSSAGSLSNSQTYPPTASARYWTECNFNAHSQGNTFESPSQYLHTATSPTDAPEDSVSEPTQEFLANWPHFGYLPSSPNGSFSLQHRYVPEPSTNTMPALSTMTPPVFSWSQGEETTQTPTLTADGYPPLGLQHGAFGDTPDSGTIDPKVLTN